MGKEKVKYAVCRGEGRQAADEFHFEDVELDYVGKFA